MIRASQILGRSDETRFAGRRRDSLSVDWADAARRRLRRRTTNGLDLALDLPRGEYLFDGAVIADDGSTIVVVAREATPTLAVSFDPTLSVEEVISGAALVGHAFGNQHVPINAVGRTIWIPVTTSDENAIATVTALGLRGVGAEVVSAPFAANEPPRSTHGSGRHSHNDHHEHA